MSLSITQYADLDGKSLDFSPIVVNQHGRIGLKLRFRCAFGVRPILIAIWAYPNGNAEPKRFGTIGEAFTYINRNGTYISCLAYEYDGIIRPEVGCDKAVYLKPCTDTVWHAERYRNPYFLYRKAIITPDGEIDVKGRYNGTKPKLFFISRPSKRSITAKFKAEQLEDAVAWLSAANNFLELAKNHSPIKFADDDDND